MKCKTCGADPCVTSTVILFRANPKGIKGEWLCSDCLNKLPMHPEHCGCAPCFYKRQEAAKAAEIDDLVERWHRGEGGTKTLPEFLGMSADEYARWLAS